MNTDRLTTGIGALIGIVIAANVDWAKLLNGDVTEISKLIGALLIAAHGYLTNKPSAPAASANQKGSAQ